jgi:hypothetical protein
MAVEWYRSLDDSEIGKCLDGILEQAFDDDFCLAMEDISGAEAGLVVDDITLLPQRKPAPPAQSQSTPLP